MTRRELMEAVGSAYRERDADGRVRAHPAWWDLAPEDREEAAQATAAARRVEAALDPRGLSTTAHAVLRRLTRS